MYLTIQKRIKYLLTLLLIVLAIILYVAFYLITTYTKWGFIGIIICFILIVVIFHLIFNYLIKHIETLTIYKMLSKKQIALCQIKEASPYQTKRDFYFRVHHIYQLKIEIYTQDHQTIDTIIYEDVSNPDFSILPTYAYVTYNHNPKTVGLISTFILFMTPKVKDIVKEYEKEYKPTYVEVIKKNGLSFKKFTNK